MNFPQKYDLKVSTRFGKNYVTVEDAANVVHELEQTIQFLKLENNRLDSNVDKLNRTIENKDKSFDEMRSYFKNSRDEVRDTLCKAENRYQQYRSTYRRAIFYVAVIASYCTFVLTKAFIG